MVITACEQYISHDLSPEKQNVLQILFLKCRQVTMKQSRGNSVYKPPPICSFVFMIHLFSKYNLYFRTYIYYDAHLLDTFFDGGGDVNVGLVASTIVARWAWPYVMTQSANDVRDVSAILMTHVILSITIIFDCRFNRCNFCAFSGRHVQ